MRSGTLRKGARSAVWRLLGGAQSRVRAYAAGGYYAEGKGLRELCAEMEDYVGEGYRAVKMKIGWPGVTLREDAERVRAVRDAVGPDVDVMIDANNGWDAVTAIKFGRMVERYDPTGSRSRSTPMTFAVAPRWRRRLDMPVASGENEYTSLGLPGPDRGTGRRHYSGRSRDLWRD